MVSKIKSIIIITLICSCQNFSPQYKSDLDKNFISIKNSDSLSAEINQIYGQDHINGFAIGIVNKEGVLYKNGFGYADRKIEKRYTEHTIQNIASISKTFLGIALLKAQEMSKLKLDDPVNKYLPFEVINPSHPDKLITIRHLATHTSSIMDTEFYGGKAYVLKEEADTSKKSIQLYVELNPPFTHTSLLTYLKKVLPANGEWYKKDGFLKNKPGEIFEYSNVGATLAALVLEIATGKPYDEFTEEYILKPLEMNSTGWSFSDIDFSKHSKLYQNKNTEIPFYSLITYPDGGLLISVDDLCKYLIELIKGFDGGGTLLNEKSYKEFFTKQLSPNHFNSNSKENEGIFLSFTSEGLIGHSGGDPGVNTHMFFNPKTLVGKILLVNSEINSQGRKQYDSILSKMESYESKLNQ